MRREHLPDSTSAERLKRVHLSERRGSRRDVHWNLLRTRVELEQRVRERDRLAAYLRAHGVGLEFPLPADRELNHHRADGSEDHHADPGEWIGVVVVASRE